VVGGQATTEAELRSLSERANTWIRLLEGRLEASERKLDEVVGNMVIRLADAVTELRQANEIRPRLVQLRGLVSQLDERARELRSHWLSS